MCHGVRASDVMSRNVKTAAGFPAKKLTETRPKIAPNFYCQNNVIDFKSRLIRAIF